MKVRASPAICLAALVALAAPAAAFVGNWVAGDRVYEQGLTITRGGDGAFRGKAFVATRGCAGEVEGTGRAEANRLVLRGRRDGQECRLTIERGKGGTLAVDEENCVYFHGTACEFAGTYRRRDR